MSAQFELDAVTRTDRGTSAARRMRREEQVPGVIYGAHQEPASITLEHRHVIKALENEAFYSHILTINIDGKAEKAVLKALQRHPFKPKVTHMDFLRVSAKEKLTMNVPLHFNGAENSPGVKAGGVMSHIMNDVEIVCLPGDLPEFIAVDVSHLDLDQAIHLSDIKLPKGVELATPVSDHNNPSVANLNAARAEAEEEAPVADEAKAAEGDKKDGDA